MADELPSPMGRNFIDMFQKQFFAVHVLLYPPKDIFSTLSILQELKPSQIYISLSFLYEFASIEAYISLHFDIFTYFCLGMLGIDSG